MPVDLPREPYFEPMDSLATREVAALFVQPEGCYSRMPGVDPWPESRDARTYAGPHPVVAHPPCATWGRYAHKAGGKGNDGGCFASALASVRRWGGILEHPSTSDAWRAFNLVPPCRIRPTLRPLEHLSKVQRAASPPAFAAWMVAVARSCRPAVDPTL